MDFPGHFEQIFQQLNYQRVHGQLCDCVIVVGSRHFKAHRAVLAACSTHFLALFSVSEGDGSVSVIRLDSEVVTAEAFSVLMDMMYTSTLTFGESNVMDVLLAASHLHLNTVVKACKHYLNTRTLPKLPRCGERASQRVEHQQLNGGSNSRLHHSFLLQQLGLSVVSSALSEEPEDEASQGAGAVSGSGLLDQRDSFYPQRRMQKRKQAFSLIRSEAEIQMQRPRLLSQAQSVVGDCGEGGARGEELLSPDSRSKTADEDSKLDVVVIGADEREEYRRASAQDDVQLPSQSDGGRRSRAELLPHKKEFPDGDGVQVKSGGDDDDDEEAPRMQVVVKSEPTSSPEPADETNDVVSQTEVSEQVEAAGEKLELSPEGSEHSFSDPQAISDILISEIKGPVVEGERAGDSGDRRERERGGGGLLSTMSFDRASVPNAMTGECTLDHEPPRFLFGSDSSSAMHLPPSQNLLSAEMQEFSNMRADALLLQPMLDGIAPSSSSEQLVLDFQRNICRSGAYRRPTYRRIAPKSASAAAAMQDTAPSSFSSSSSMLVNGANFDAPSQRGSATNLNPLPQLTRASADVLSKCKKALSEHNVLVVEGARKYACKICCKTFLTLTDCKKHIRVHTGEKPYACLKCGKRFSQSSHLYKHSKTTCLRWQNSTMSTGLL